MPVGLWLHREAVDLAVIGAAQAAARAELLPLAAEQPTHENFRYRRPSLNTLLGLTKAKKRVKKELGITAAMKPFRWWTNQKRRFKRKIGYESDAGRLIRNGLPRPGGCLMVVIWMMTTTIGATVVFLIR